MSPRALLLAAGAFAVGTSAYVVAGVLPEMSAELGVSVSVAGQSATAFSLAYAVGAPLMASLAGRWDRRTLLVGALLLAAVGNAISAVAGNYALLLVGRVVAALGAAAFTPAATMVATRYYPPHQRGRAVALVFGGLTLALAVGVPAGTFLGGALGYRGVFALIAAAGLVTAVGTRLALDPVPPPPAVSLRARFAVAADRRVVTVLVVTVLGVLAVMSVYTYVVPLLRTFTGVSGLAITGLLVAYGVGALVGNLLGGRLTDRIGSRPTVLLSLGGVILLLATLPLTLPVPWLAAPALFAWSVFTWAFNPPFQHLVLEVAGEQGALALSLNASAIYFGAGLSGVVGGLVIDTAGVPALPLVGALLGVVAAGVFLTAHRPSIRLRAARDRAAEQAPVASAG